MSTLSDVNTNLRYGLGGFFIAFNVCLLIAAVLQVIRSRNHVSGDKNETKIRVLELMLILLLTFIACIDTDFWVWSSEILTTGNKASNYSIISSSIPSFMWQLNIILKSCIDILFCVIGSMIVYSLIRTYFVTQILSDPNDFPPHIRKFWYGVSISFTIIVILCVVVALAGYYVLIHIYGAIRLLYLFIACGNLTYTYYWVFYKADEDIKKHLRNSIILALFAILCFIGAIWSIYNSISNYDLWNEQTVVCGCINYPEQGLIAPLIVIFVGWGGYWFVSIWYLKFVWISGGGSNELQRRNTGTINAVSKLEMHHTVSKLNVQSDDEANEHNNDIDQEQEQEPVNNTENENINQNEVQNQPQINKVDSNEVIDDYVDVHVDTNDIINEEVMVVKQDKPKYQNVHENNQQPEQFGQNLGNHYNQEINAMDDMMNEIASDNDIADDDDGGDDAITYS